ncbi:DUF3987 domain-containing protein [Zoogloea sp.]|jgi:hypothetical protein|uniref:DUF3987 domain-containing protein n=1 Tax=Zoogloea sp. TaxID=49181 RepID=UPI0037DA1CF0
MNPTIPDSLQSSEPGIADDAFADVPEIMKQARRWLVWRAERYGTGKPRKVPYYADGARRGGADTETDRARLVTFDQAVMVLKSGAYTGLGFALGPDEEGGCWQGVDLDNVPDRPELGDLVPDLPGYTETSPSGRGYHAIGYGPHFPALGSNSTGIEAYAAGRFFTVTGEGAGIGEPCDLSDFVASRLAPMHKGMASNAPTTTPEAAPAQYVDAAVQRDLRSALTALRADDRDTWVRMGHALKTIGEPGRALWLEWSQTSDKWQPPDARQWDTFHPATTSYQAVFAEAQRAGWLNPMSNAARMGGADTSGILGQGQPLPQLPALPQLPEAPAPSFDLDFPPGLVGRMAEHVLAASRCGVKSYAIVAALITASFLIRGTSWVEGSNTALNLYTCMIGETGKGKEEPRRGVKRLVKIVGRIGGVVEGVASGPALLRAMAVEPNRLLLTDEFGMFLQAALADHGSIHLKELTKEILSLFGLGRSVYTGRCYSDAKLNIDPIENPYLCVMGTTTSTELMEALNRRSVESGLMNRFLFVEAVGMEPINRFVDDQVPADLEREINAQFGNFGPSGAIGYDDGAHELMVDLATAMANDALGEFAAMWSRSEELMIRVAGVLAVGDGRTITTRHIDWAHRFVRWSIESMLQRMGREMHETDFDRQCKRVVEIIGNPRKYADDRKFSDDLQQGYMPHAKLLKLMKMKAKEFQDLISTLLESQQIEVIKVPSSGKDKVLYVLQR